MAVQQAFLQQRAQALAQIRQFFADREVLEVDTPILSQAAATDPQLDSFTTQYQPANITYYLQTSPEFAMKRLLAQGVGSIYQVAKVFRNGEASQRHNPEFTLLEWYRPHWTYHQLSDEVCGLLSLFLPTHAIERWSYQACFQRVLDLDPFTCSLADYHRVIAKYINVDLSAFQTIDDCRHLLMTHLIEPQFDPNAITIVYDYPASQAMLAEVEGPVAKRFEIYSQGLELANGFQELTCPIEQRQRFQQDLSLRQAQQRPAVLMDERLLAALSAMPPCAGVAVGLERLWMAAFKQPTIQSVLCFDITQS